MGDLEKLLKDGFGQGMDLNCAEKIFYGANWAYGLKLNLETLKTAAGFGGGMGAGLTCGALTAGVMVLTHLFVDKNGHEDEGRIKKITSQFITLFRKELGAVNCSELKPKYHTAQKGCEAVVIAAAKALDATFSSVEEQWYKEHVLPEGEEEE